MKFSKVMEILTCKQAKRIGYTSGVFDLLHHGHVNYLKVCQEQCDILVVGVDSDRRVKAAKGNDRPRDNQSKRIVNIERLGYLTFVKHVTSSRYLRIIRSSLYFYPSTQARKAIVARGNLPFVSFVEVEDTPGISTTAIIANMKTNP